MRVYLDNCCYNRPYDDQSDLKISLETQAKLKIQNMIVDGEIELVSSYVLITENSQNPVEAKRDNIKSYIDANTSIYVDIKNIDEIDSEADVIMDTGVKYMDACHIACAMYAKCDYFISTDRRLLKFSCDGMELLNPIDFLDVIDKTDES